MDLLNAVALLAAGVAAGTVNAVAGGGSLITFPTLIAIGLPPVPANVSNSLAVTPGYLASVAGSRSDLAALARVRNLLVFAPTAVIGAAAGCVLLLVTPARAFDLVVPFLVLGATAVLAFQQQLRRLVGRVGAGRGRSGRGGLGPARGTDESRLGLHVTIGLGAAYGGYFGAALGIMLVAALGLVLDETLARVNALKNAISAVVALVTVVAYGLFGPVQWLAVAVVAPASMLGGYLGARLARRLPARALRVAIVVAGTVVGLVLLARLR